LASARSPSPAPSSPPLGTQKVPSGAIVYLCCADEAEVLDLRRSLRMLHEHFNGFRRYPVIIFHDMLTAAHVSSIREDVHHAADDSEEYESNATTLDRAPWLSFEVLDDSVFSFPAHMTAAQRDGSPQKVRGYGHGYRHMCRFFSGPLFSHRALHAYELVWRLDSDSFLLAPPLSDPFADMDAMNASYAWIDAYRDEDVFVTGLWATTKRHLDSRGIDEGVVHAWVPGGKRWPETPMCFATNCFLARRSWFLSREYTDYFNHLDATGGFYAYRWGDACVHMLAVAAFLPPSAVLRLHSLAYWHQGTVILPSRQTETAARLLGALPAPKFARRLNEFDPRTG
jgi:hypothetical protein